MIARRAVIFGLGTCAIVMPLTARAEEARKIVGVLLSQPDAHEDQLGAFRGKLGELGYEDGRDLRIVTRSADGQLDRLPGLATELVRMKPNVIVSMDTPPTRAAINATIEIPIVMATGNPIATGFVSNLPRPEGNVTGIAMLPVELHAKRLQLLTEVASNAKRIAVLFNPDDPVTAPAVGETERAAPQLGVELRLLPVRTPDELIAAFNELTRWQADAMLWIPGQGAFVQQPMIDFAIKQRLPLMTGGGLISYFPDQSEIGRIIAIDVDRILKGAKPGDLPVQQPTKFKLVINLRTAKALGLTVPLTLLGRADEVIE
jgi:putative tryptophan/tyrosine transport system substrate-binding protein